MSQPRVHACHVHRHVLRHVHQDSCGRETLESTLKSAILFFVLQVVLEKYEVKIGYMAAIF